MTHAASAGREDNDMDAKRGRVPEDERNFSPEAVRTLREASRHVLFLINEGYGLRQASTFVGNHFLLSERQRLAVARSVAAKEQLELRKKKEVPLTGLAGGEVIIDGFNTVITLEVMLCGSPLFKCMDGTVRDLAALRGTYRIIPETHDAVRIMLDALRDAGVSSAAVLLDEPVSNSGRLKALMADAAEGYPFSLDVRVMKDVDRALYYRERAVTTDSVILDRCGSWVNLAAAIAERYGRQALRVW